MILPLFFLFGCAPKPIVISDKLPDTYVIPSEYVSLSGWEAENFDEMLLFFKQNCTTKKAQKLYGDLCQEAGNVSDAKAFFEASLRPYKLIAQEAPEEGLMTGYYEPLLQGSLKQSKRYAYPVYAVPDDLVTVKLDTIYPELKGIRLRGRLEGTALVPYSSREAMKESNAPVICYVDDKIALFFLEVQGSGRIELDNSETIFVGFSNQNGHPYRSIGKYLVAIGEIAQEEISLQSIRVWFDEHPERVDEILNHNPSYVFFQERTHSATGSLGLALTPERSIAVDTHYLPLGSMLFMQSRDPLTLEPIRKTVFAQDTGGAIKGEVRADLFWGFGEEAERKAGKMQEPLELWILMPK
ncbi:MAG: MltA domain-containing protein, partial [Campylobacterota bacterium]|nr:MltA domain-containing protein [Campylobacterota bacterium]